MARVDTELLGLQIVAANDATVVGEVDGLIVDDVTLKVAGFLVDLGLFEASALPLASASAIGADAIIVPSADALVPITTDATLDALAAKDITISDARVITRSGKTVGTIGDFFVDTDTGDVVGMEFIADDQSIYPKDVAVLPRASVLRVGRDIIVVSDDYLQRLQRDSGSLNRLTHEDTGTLIITPREPVEVTKTGSEDAPTPDEASSAAEEPPVASEPPVADEPAGTTEAPAPSVEDAPKVITSDNATLTDPPAPTTPDEAVGTQQRHFLIGKRVLRRIEGIDGEVIAEEGDTVTHEMIQRARSNDQLLILSLNVE